jgi:predicted ATPase/class 3 adenylate cyclase/DNA-binding CsgD family transcriptional regulator
MRELPTGTVTLLFMDIEGSTRVLQQVGERYASILEACRSLLRTAVHEIGGHEVDTQGDAFFVAFARATDAVLAAVAAQRSLASHPWSESVTVRVRMGLHTGEPERSTEGYVGLDVYRAACIMSAGHGGQVLLSQVTRDLVEHILPEDVGLRDLGEHRLKDLGRPSHLYQLVIAGLPADFPPLKTLDSHSHNLPVQPTPFIGREKEVAAIQQQLLRQDVRLLTLTGPGGVGKTRLGLQVAAESSERFADGTWYVSLAPISDPDLVIPAIAETLAVREARGWSLLEQLKASLHEKRVLLLLDNFEQVVSAAAQVADLLSACPQLTVLVTSREALHVRAEHDFPVPVLALPDPKHLPDLVTLSQYEAVALFIERARAVKPDFQVTNANAPAVAEVCARLDGLPLAIELAAARSKLFPPQALLARLDQRLQLLTSSLRDVPARQQTLRKTIQWSYDLLAAQEQRHFRRLSVFIGGCTLQAIETLTSALGNETLLMLDEVASLVDKNLLQQTVQEGVEPRLTMLETIREYGLEALSISGEMEMARQAHAAYYLTLAEEAARDFRGIQQAIWLERLEREHDNLRAALQWSLEPAQAGSNPEVALRLCEALEVFWDVRGLYSEGRTFLEQTLAGSEGVTVPLRARALSAAAGFAFAQSDYDRAEELCQESLVLYRELGDTRGIAYSLQGLALIAPKKGSHIETTCSLLEESLALYRKLDDKKAIAWSLVSLADFTSFRGEYSRGLALYKESLSIHRELGNKRGVAVCLKQSALVLFGVRGGQSIIRTRLKESLTIFRELGDKDGMAFCFWLSGWAAFSQGDLVTAQNQLEQSLELWQDIGDRWRAIWVLPILGRVTAQQGDFVAARAIQEKSLARARGFHDRWLYAFCLEGLASVVAAQGEETWAVHLWGAAESLRENCGIPLTPVERVDYEPAVAAVRIHLGEQAFAIAWARGRTMTLEQVLEVPARAAMPTPTSREQSLKATGRQSPSNPAGLTAREVEVLRLVAQGLTDAQVADRLVISPRTVNTHLTSIYNKLGVDTRTAASRFAVDQQLV